eukprot:TRINITY_DN1523_c0_g4_i6.p1 TRINITY_DN1523_c0_g4~~TRINITY_DN1523_c0_g4_i6.p1  ORF type:complete len:270 (+),score=80.65 TRINITY_DN1523_c0_g4_i6:472-1281(+)
MGSIEEIVIGEYKLQLLERIDLGRELIESVPIGLEIDPKDVNSFIVMAEEKIYRNTRIVTMENMCRKYQFKELLYARPSAMAISDEGIFLVGFDDGSLGLYSQHYTIPLSIWQNVAEAKIVALKWSSVYFDDISKDAELATQNMKGGDKKDFASSYKNNLLEFYLIDEQGNFQIWNLSKLVNNKVYTVNLKKTAGLEGAIIKYEITDTAYNKWIYLTAADDNNIAIFKVNLSKAGLAEYVKLIKTNIRAKKIIASLPNGWDMPDIRNDF